MNNQIERQTSALLEAKRPNTTLSGPLLIVLLLQLLISGCAAMSQDPKTVLIREPGSRTYNPAVSIVQSARELWQYAVLSENVYVDGWSAPSPERNATNAVPPRSSESLAAYPESCASTGQLPLPDWAVWKDFPSKALQEKAREVGLYMEVWEKMSSPPTVVVVFRGTEFFSWRDWMSNFRWFSWLLRFLPGYRDQYTVVAEDTGKEVLENLKARIEKGRERYKNVRLITTGHSLGGGLAQHLAYSLPQIQSSDGTTLPRVTDVYAFDPSPVTGWYSVRNTELRSLNAKGLRIDRVFEHGEILAYIRLLMSYINPPSASDPAIRELRYNFVQSINPFSSHSMRLIACALMQDGRQLKGGES
jgi:hypothetical protein